MIQHSTSVSYKTLFLESVYTNSADESQTNLCLYMGTCFNPETVKSGNQMEKEFIDNIAPFHVVIRGDGPRRDFVRQTFCSMLAAMLRHGSELHPCKLELSHYVHVLIQPHLTISADIVAHEKLGFVKIATCVVFEPGTYSLGTVRLAAQVGQILANSWIDPLPSKPIGADIIHPFTLVFKQQHQDQITAWRHKQHMLHVQLVITRLIADDIKCYYEIPNVRLEDPRDLERSMCIVRSEFPKINPSILSK